MRDKKADKQDTMTSSLNRRSLLKGAGIVGAASLLSACGGNPECDSQTIESPAITSKKRTLKMVTSWPKNFPGLGTTAQDVSRRIEALSGGQIQIKVYAGGELVGPLGAFDAVSEGKADMYHAAEYYWQGKSKAFNFFGAVPFGMTAAERNAWLRFDGGQQLWDKLSAGFKIKPFACGNSGPQMGGWYNRDINTLDDFKGLRIRMPGLGGDVMAKLGATPVTKPGSELYQALSQGNIDAAEWIGPWNDLAFGFHNIVKNYYSPGIHEPGPTLSMGVNLDLWNDFSPWEKEIFQTATAAQNDLTYTEFNARNARALNTLVNEHGVKLKKFSDEILARMAELSIEVMQEAASTDAITKEVYESFKASRANSMRWTAIGESTFTSARSKMKDL